MLAIAFTQCVHGQSSSSVPVTIRPVTLGTLSAPYTVIPVGFVSRPNPVHLNDYGQVISIDNFERSALLWTPATRNATRGNYLDLQSTGLQVPTAQIVINSRGQIAADNVLWSPAAPNGTSGTKVDTQSGFHASAINDFGQIVGHGYLWTPSAPNGQVGTLVTDNRFSNPLDLNNFGQVLTYDEVTSRLFTPLAAQGSSGTFVELPRLPGVTLEPRKGH